MTCNVLDHRLAFSLTPGSTTAACGSRQGHMMQNANRLHVACEDFSAGYFLPLGPTYENESYSRLFLVSRKGVTLRLSGRGTASTVSEPRVRLESEVICHRVLAHRAVIRNRGEGMTLGSVASPPSHDPLTRQNTLPREIRYEVPSGPSASRSAFQPALAAAEPGLG